jgi:hypothetical protein
MEIAVATGLGEMTQIADAVGRGLAGFDPVLVPASEAVAWMKVFDRIKRMGAAGETLAAGRVAETVLWRRNGARSAAHWVADETGVSVSDAVGVLKTAQALENAEATADAFKAGKLSGRQVQVIAGAVSVAPSVERELIAAADRLSIGELRDKAKRLARAGSVESDQQRTARWRSQRCLRTWVDDDGMGCGLWKVPPADQARVIAAIDGVKNTIFHDARRDDRRESAEAYAADALVTIAQKATGASGTPVKSGVGRHSASDVKVIVRVDHSALVRGEVAAGEVCEIAGIGPVDLATVREWVEGDAFKAAIVTEGTDIRSIVHLGRRPTELQRTALQWHTAGTCAIEGCTSIARMEIDHVAEWSTTGRTTLDELARVCGHHHDLKTHNGHRFGPLGESGKRPLIAPHTPLGDSPDTS